MFQYVQPVQFVEVGIPLERSNVMALLKRAVAQANLLLGEDIVELDENALAGGNYLLSIKTRPIDIIDPKAVDEKSFKPEDRLAGEVVAKVKQHLLAEKTEGIFISSSGSKFDARQLRGHEFFIDEAGYLVLDDHRVCIATAENTFVVLKAEQFRSYTIHRLVNEDLNVRFFDDYDLVRIGSNKGMKINVSRAVSLAKEQIALKNQADAETYQGQYFQLYRDEITGNLLYTLNDILRTFPAP
ncbi:MAG: hypothetical protein V4494_03030 [Chlamydiota bacterium]